jgi:hypothetical protein
VITLTPHSHEKDEEECKVLILKQTMKLKAAENSLTSVDIITSIVKESDEKTIAKLPKLSSIRDNIRRIKNKTNSFMPKEAVDFPDELCVTLSKKRFLLFDSGVSSVERLVIFSSETGINTLKLANIWQVDGTFNVCPHPFYQLFVIHSYVFGTTFPCVFALMSSKPQKHILNCLKF